MIIDCKDDSKIEITEEPKPRCDDIFFYPFIFNGIECGEGTMYCTFQKMALLLSLVAVWAGVMIIGWGDFGIYNMDMGQMYATNVIKTNYSYDNKTNYVYNITFIDGNLGLLVASYDVDKHFHHTNERSLNETYKWMGLKCEYQNCSQYEDYILSYDSGSKGAELLYDQFYVSRGSLHKYGNNDYYDVSYGFPYFDYNNYKFALCILYIAPVLLVLCSFIITNVRVMISISDNDVLFRSQDLKRKFLYIMHLNKYLIYIRELFTVLLAVYYLLYLNFRPYQNMCFTLINVSFAFWLICRCEYFTRLLTILFIQIEDSDTVLQLNMTLVPSLAANNLKMNNNLKYNAMISAYHHFYFICDCLAQCALLNLYYYERGYNIDNYEYVVISVSCLYMLTYLMYIPLWLIN